MRDAKPLRGRIVAFAADVTDASALGDAATQIEATLGPIDLAILNAGTHEPVDMTRPDMAVFERLLRVNVLGAVNGFAAVLPAMLTRKRGRICVVASVAGYRGLPTAAAYGASKAALINMAEAARLELAPRGIDVRLVNPGFVRTPLTDRNPFPMPFLMEADAAAERVWRGLEHGRRFEITFPRRFTWMLKLLRALPYAAYFALVTRRIRP